MLKPVMQDALNEQINAELFSGYLYLSMAAYFESRNLKGMANWMRVQEQEERFHALKFYDYIVERGGTVVLGAIAAPETAWA
ncbi:MAG TPA: ferritin, partial [bacterium]|nr:ferritin [bacterium]